jgi:MFS transporter, YNFM family, putative membrane transport protein
MIPPPAWPVVLAGFTAFVNLYATQPLLPMLVRVFRATPLGVSWTVTAGTLAVAGAAPLIGRLADRVGQRRVIVSSAALLALATGLAATSQTLGQLVAWRFVQGLLTPGISAVTIAYVHERWPASHSGRATGAYVSGTVIGGFCGRATAGIVASAFSWQAAFLTLSGMLALTAAALWRWLPAEDPGSDHEPAAPAGALLRLLANRQLLVTDAVGFCVLFTQVAAFTYVTFHLAAPPFGLGTFALASLFVVYLLGAAITPFAGRWADAVGHRAALAGGVAAGMCGAILTLLPSLSAVIVGLALIAAGVFIAQATASSYIGAATAEDRGLAVGLYSTSYYAGGSAGGSLPAVMWNTGGWPATVMLVMVVQAVTLGLAWTFWIPRHATHEPPLPDAGG